MLPRCEFEERSQISIDELKKSFNVDKDHPRLCLPAMCHAHSVTPVCPMYSGVDLRTLPETRLKEAGVKEWKVRIRRSWPMTLQLAPARER